MTSLVSQRVEVEANEAERKDRIIIRHEMWVCRGDEEEWCCFEGRISALAVDMLRIPTLRYLAQCTTSSTRICRYTVWTVAEVLSFEANSHLFFFFCSLQSTHHLQSSISRSSSVLPTTSRDTTVDGIWELSLQTSRVHRDLHRFEYPRGETVVCCQEDGYAESSFTLCSFWHAEVRYRPSCQGSVSTIRVDERSPSSHFSFIFIHRSEELVGEVEEFIIKIKLIILILPAYTIVLLDLRLKNILSYAYSTSTHRNHMSRIASNFIHLYSKLRYRHSWDQGTLFVVVTRRYKHNLGRYPSTAILLVGRNSCSSVCLLLLLFFVSLNPLLVQVLHRHQTNKLTPLLLLD